MNPEPTLIACPFCNASGEALKILSHTVVCNECDAAGPMPSTTLSVRPTRGQVIAAWNLRSGAYRTLKQMTTDDLQDSLRQIREFGEKAKELLKLLGDNVE